MKQRGGSGESSEALNRHYHLYQRESPKRTFFNLEIVDIIVLGYEKSSWWATAARRYSSELGNADFPANDTT